MGVGKNLLLEETFLFQGKKRRTFLFHVEKEPKDRKGKRLPLPFPNPSPLTSAGKATLLECTGLTEAAGYIGDKRI